MAIELDHTIVPAHDPQASAQFLAGILGLPVDPPVAQFTPVTLANGVSLDFLQRDDRSIRSRTAAGAPISVTPTATSWKSSPR
jgi:hypothetical protein